MCSILACPVLMDYGVMQEFELTGEHNGRANHIISVGQVENFDKLDTSERSQRFFSNFSNMQLFEVCIMSNTKT